MKKNKRLFILLTLYFSIGQIDAQIPLSFEESLHLLNQGNQSLKIVSSEYDLVGLTVAEPMPRVAIKLRNMLNQLPLLKD